MKCKSIGCWVEADVSLDIRFIDDKGETHNFSFFRCEKHAQFDSLLSVRLSALTYKGMQLRSRIARIPGTKNHD